MVTLLNVPVTPQPPQPPHPHLPTWPPTVRKAGAPLAAIIGLSVVVGLLMILLTATNPVGTAIGFVLSSIAITVVLLCYLWLDRWEPEPPRLLILAFLWGASVAIILSLVFVGYELHLTRKQTELTNWRELLEALTDYKAATNDLAFAEFLVRAHQDYGSPSEAEKMSFGLFMEQGVHIYGNFLKLNDSLDRWWKERAGRGVARSGTFGLRRWRTGA